MNRVAFEQKFCKIQLVSLTIDLNLIPKRQIWKKSVCYNLSTPMM